MAKPRAISVSGIENLIGSDLNDVLFGNAEVNELYGGDGIDALQGGVGADYLDGGDSLDWAVYFDAPGPLIIDLVTPGLSSAYFAEDTLVSIEIIGGAEQLLEHLPGRLRWPTSSSAGVRGATR